MGDGKELTRELADSIAKLKFLRKDIDHVYNKKQSRDDQIQIIRKKAFSRLTAHPLSHRSNVWSKMSTRSPKNTSPSGEMLNAQSYRNNTNMGFDEATFGLNNLTG